MDEPRSLKVNLPEGCRAVLGQPDSGLAVENGEYILVTKFASEEAIRADERQKVWLEAATLTDVFGDEEAETDGEAWRFGNLAKVLRARANGERT